MKKTLLMLVAVGICYAASAQMESSKQIFESPKLRSVAGTHKLVAILPFNAKISYKRQPKNFSVEANQEQERNLSTAVQSGLYTFLLRRGKDYTVEFQDVEKTNILLKKAGMLEKLNEFTKDEIAKVLGVDAVLGGNFESQQTKSEAGAIASTILFGSIASKTATGSLTLTLNEAAEGALLWRFYKSMNEGLTSSMDDLVDRMMRKVSRNFPYLKS